MFHHPENVTGRHYCGSTAPLYRDTGDAVVRNGREIISVGVGKPIRAVSGSRPRRFKASRRRKPEGRMITYRIHHHHLALYLRDVCSGLLWTVP